MKIVLERRYLEMIASKKKLPFCFSKAKRSVTITFNNLLCISRFWNNVQGCGGCCFLQYCERALEVGEFLPVAAEASLFHSLPVDQKGIYFPKLGAQVKICLTLTFPMQAFLFVYRNKWRRAENSRPSKSPFLSYMLSLHILLVTREEPISINYLEGLGSQKRIMVTLMKIFFWYSDVGLK